MSEYTLIHGDCRATFALMKPASVNAVITDIPYNAVTRPSGGYRKLDKGAADVATFSLSYIVRESARVATDWVYIWCDWRQVSPLLRLMERAGLSVRMGAWCKDSWSPMNGHLIWSSAMEVCAIGRKANAPFYRQARPPIWNGPTETAIKWHPTPKPVWLMREIVTSSVPPGGLIFDPCGGSGSTGVAALEEGRRVIVCELSDVWFPKMSERITGAQRGLFAHAEPPPALIQESIFL